MLVLALAGLIAMTSKDQVDLSWMSGSWLDCTGDREAMEVWSTPRNGVMVGFNLTTRGEQSGFEYARIERLPDGRLAYVAQPQGEPPTVFPMLRYGDVSVTFSNPQNDFPHRIVYWLNQNRLFARIEGADDEPERSAQWSFNKMKLNRRCPH